LCVDCVFTFNVWFPCEAVESVNCCCFTDLAIVIILVNDIKVDIDTTGVHWLAFLHVDIFHPLCLACVANSWAPLGNLAACSFCFVPAEMSITVPVMVTVPSMVTPEPGADTVVWLGPLPIA